MFKRASVFSILIGIALVLVRQAPPDVVQVRLASAADRLAVFETYDWLYDRLPFRASGAERATLEQLRRDVIPIPLLLKLLHDPQPKVRTLAMALIFAKEDPHLLPHLLPLTQDSAFTLPRSYSVAHVLPQEARSKRQRQTVGEVARTMLNFYLSEAGYTYGVNDPRGFPGWNHYWQARQARPYCLSWLRVLKNRATKGTTPLQPESRAPLERLRERTSGLPEPERDLYLLWLNAGGEKAHRFATDTELLAAAIQDEKDRS